MKLIDELVGRAAEADAEMGDLAQEGTANYERQRAYSRLENTLDRMTADGYLDAKELKELQREFRAQGLDTKSIEKLMGQMQNQDGVTRVAATPEAVLQLRNELFDGKTDATNGPLFNLRAQNAMSEYQRAFDTAARASKAEHDIYMVAIRHLAG